MVCCAAVGCFQRTDRKKVKDIGTTKITFHKFPKNPILRSKWIRSVKRDKNWLPSNRDVLCSLHFTEDCFNRTLEITRLRDNAAPTVFLSAPERQLQQSINKEEKCQPKTEEDLLLESHPPTSSKENDQQCIREFVFVKEQPLF